MATIRKKLKRLGDLKGRTYREIAAVCGEADSVKNKTFGDIGAGSERTWGRFFHTVTMKFNIRNQCYGIVRRRWPALYFIAALLVIVGILFTVDQLTGHHVCEICGEPATNELYGKWYCDDDYEQMVQYFDALGLG
jgi:hypothetical protein